MELLNMSKKTQNFTNTVHKLNNTNIAYSGKLAFWIIDIKSERIFTNSMFKF